VLARANVTTLITHDVSGPVDSLAMVRELASLDAATRTVASFKIPRHVVFVDEFPMTSTGKIQKVRLRAEARRMLG
jgi:acyl-CoA synthetase (AMP-forming)/AMP-acid ligase II